MRRFRPSRAKGTFVGPVDEEPTHSDTKRLGRRFLVEREVGRGGVGIVYRAFDLTTQRTVALKVIAPERGVPGRMRANSVMAWPRSWRVRDDLVAIRKSRMSVS